MYRIILVLSILTLIPLNTFGGGAKPAPPKLSISVSTKDVFYVNQKVKFSGAGGTTPYTFSANIGVINKTTGDYTAPASAGTASVRVTDKKGNTATYNVPVYFYLSISPTSASVATGSNSSFSGSGGLGPYKFSTNKGTIGTNGVLTSLTSAGPAVVTVTDSRNNKANSNVTIYQSLGITPTSSLIMVGKTFTFKGTGGIGSYSYSTNKGSIASNGVFTAPPSTGPAVITVTDSRGAKATAAVTIYPSLALNPPSKILCVKGQATFTASGGYGAIVLSTNNGGIVNGLFTAPTSAGSAVITARDSLGNTAISNVTINPDLSLAPSNIHLAINGTSNFTATGGVAPLSFSSSYGSISPGGAYKAPAVEGLGTITLTDSSTPKLIKTASVCVFTPLKIFPQEKTVVVGKTFNISASGGCKPYTYSIRNNIGSFVAATGNTINYTAPGTPPANNVKAVVRVTDNAGMFAEANITISSALALTPPPLTMPINGTHNFTPTGGVPPYTYTVNSGGGSFTGGSYKASGNESTASVTVTDSDEPKFSRTYEICVYEPLQIAPERTVKGLIQGDPLTFVATHGCKPYRYSKDIGQIVEGSGVYTATQIGRATITVTDLANKNASSSVTVYGPLALNSSPPLLKLGTSFIFSATGGIPDLSWSASPGNIAQDGNFTPTVKGIANIVVSDSASHNKNVSINVYEQLNISPGKKTLAVNDKYKFTISGGYFSLDKMIHVTAGKGIVDEAGNYTAPAVVGDGTDNITVKDSAGNIVSTELITIRPALAIDPTFANLGVNQSLKFNVTGGVGNYSYISSMDRRDFDLNGNFSSLRSGIADITVTDEGGHTVAAKVNVYDPVQILPKDKTLAADDSFDRFTATGGVPGLNGYTFTQDIGSIESKTGVYRAPDPTPPLEAPVTGSVWVRDSLGNPAQANITINPSLSLLPEVKNVQVNRERTFTIKGGIGPFTFDIPSKGQISPNGVYKAPAAGPGNAVPVSIIVRDSASPSKHSDSSIINIYDELKISPLSVNLMVGDPYPFTITGGLGTRFPVTDNNLKGTIDSLGGFVARAEGDVKITVTDSENDPYPNYVVPNKVEAMVHVFPKLRLNPPTAYVEAGFQIPFTIIGGVGNRSFDPLPLSKGSITSEGVYTAPPAATGPVAITVWDEGRRHSFTASIIVYDKLTIATNPVDRRDLAVKNRVPLIITGGVSKNNEYRFVKADIGSIDPATGDYVAPSTIGNQTSVVAKVEVIDYLDKTAFLEITIHPELKIIPPSAIMAVDRTLRFQGQDGVPGTSGYKYSVKDKKGDIDLMSGWFTARPNSDPTEVIVTDSLGNTATSIVTVNGEIDITPKNINLLAGSTELFQGSGGIGPYTYSVSNQEQEIGKFIDPKSGNFTALKAGDVDVFVTDSEGFIIKTPAKVRVYEKLEILPIEKDLAVDDPYKFKISGGLPNLSIKPGITRGTIDIAGNYTAPADVGDGKDTITFYDSANPVQEVSAHININSALTIIPPTANVEIKKTLPFSARGGVGKLTYTALRGTFIADSNGDKTIYKAPDSLGINEVTFNDTITVTDTPTDPSATPHSDRATVTIYNPLKITPDDKLLALGSPLFNFLASGGIPPYEFGFVRKVGEISTEGNLGKYLAPGLGGTADTGEIYLEDKIKNRVLANIRINTSLAVNAPPALPFEDSLNFGNIVSGGIPDYSYSTPSFGEILNGVYKPTGTGNEAITITDSSGVSVIARFCVFKPLTISPSQKTLVVLEGQNLGIEEGCKPYKRAEAVLGTFPFNPGAISGLFTALDHSGPAKVTVYDNVYDDITVVVKAVHMAVANITVEPELSIKPQGAMLKLGNSSFLTFEGVGGVGTPSFKILSGGGSINETSGVYTASGDKKEDVIIQVTDAAEPTHHTANATLHVYESLEIIPERNEIAVGDTIKYEIKGGYLREGGSYRVDPVGGNSNDITLEFSATAADTDSVKGSLKVTDMADPVNSATANIKINPTLTLTSDLDKVVSGGTIQFSANGGVGQRTFRKVSGTGNIDPGTGVYIASENLTQVEDVLIEVADNYSPTKHTKSLTVKVYPALQITLDHYDLAVTNETHYSITGGFGSPSSYKVESANSEKQPAGGIYTAPGNVPAGEKDTIKVTDEAGNEASVVANIYPALKINPLSARMAVGRKQLFEGVDGVPYKAVDGGPYYRFSVKVGGGEDNNLTTGYYTATDSGEVKVTVWDAMGNSAFSIVTVNKAIEIDSPSYLAVGGNKKISARDGVGVLKFYFVNEGANQGDIGEISGVFTAPASKGLVYIKAVDEQGIAAETWVNVYNPVEIDPTEKIIVAGITPFEFTAKKGAGDTASIGAISGSGPYSFTSDAIIGSILTNGNKGSFTTVPIAGVPQNGITAKVFVRDSLAVPGEVASATVTVNPALFLYPKPAYLAKGATSTYNFGTSTHGGVPPYTYEPAEKFSNGIYTASESGETVTITVKDSVNTAVTATFCVYAPIEFDPPGNKILAKDNPFTFQAKEGCKPYKFAATIGLIDPVLGTFSSSMTGPGDITVTDASNQNSALIQVTINPPLRIEPIGPSLEVSKSGLPNSLNFTAQDGVPPYRSFTLGSSPKGTISFGGGSTANYVAPINPGSDQITVTDDFGNTANTTVTVYGPLAISPPGPINIQAGPDPIPFTASGGVKNYGFSLSNTVGSITPSGSTTGNTTSYSPTTKGETQLTLTDSANPPKSITVDINVYDPLSISPPTNQNIGKADVIHFSAQDGLPGPSGYIWSVLPSSGANLVKSADGLSADFSAPDITALSTFFVRVTDSVNTFREITVGVYPPVTISPPSITLSVQGNATFTAGGGTGSYVFSKTIGSIDQEGIFSALNEPGTGTVTVTDSILTNLSASANVTIIPKFMLVPSVASVEAGKTYSFLISGGVAPFTFSVDGTNRGSVSISGTNLIYTAPSGSGAAGAAVIRGEDSLKNTTVANVTVFSGLGITPPSINLAKNATTTFSATGGTPPFTWSKDYGTITPSGVNNINGIYNFSEMVLTAHVTVTDSTGKTATAIVTGDFPGTWIWASGVKEFNQGGKTGTGGYPGARGGSSNWADNNGNVYLQGGVGWGLNITSSSKTIILYYLWKYDTKDFTWTAIEQGPQYGNYGSWTNNNKNPPVAPQTTDTTSPGGRFGAATWTGASGNILWLFGGKGYGVSDTYEGGSDNYGHLNDLWRYEIATGKWTWVKGSPLINKFGVYGTKGTPANANYPGSRVRSVKWRDLSGNLWLFGGYGYGESGVEGLLNDLWKFTPSTNSPFGQWTWVAGSKTINPQGNYTTGIPGGREGGTGWMSSDGKLWLFGGNGLPNNSTPGLLNDLWKYDPSLNQWSYVKGRAPDLNGFYEINKAGSYGTKNTAGPNNLPGSRERAVGFTDSKGNLWLFGGYGNGNSIGNGYLNDLWRINILSPTPQWAWERGSDVTGGAGDWGTIGVAADTNIPDARSAPVSWQDSNGLFWFFGGGQTRDEVDKGINDVKYHNDLWKFFPE